MATTTTNRSGGRPRDLETEARILDAAYELYAEKGWREFSLGEVCRRSQTGKSAIYLRWSGKVKLLFTAIAAHEVDWASCDTGDIRSDLLMMAKLEYICQTSGHSAVLFRLTSDASTYPELAHAVDSELYKAPIRESRAIVKRAIARRQLPSNASTALITDMVIGAVMSRAVATPSHLRAEVDAATDVYLEALVDTVLVGTKGIAHAVSE